MTARVIVHADDFGLHPALNDGIERAYREGIVTSASLMPRGPAFDDAVRRSQAMPELDLGLHFTLVGVPGCPPTLGVFLARYLRGGLPAREVAASLRRQLDAVRCLPISHLDSHQHLHALPSIMRVVCPIAAKYGIQAIRLPLDGPAYAPISPGRRAQAAALAVMARLSRRYIAASGLRTSDHFSGMAVSGHLTAPILAAYLRNAQEGVMEIVCHPGADNIALAQSFDWGYDWEGELAALYAPEARQALTESAVGLTDWRTA
ncbi:MAG: ChbG/HpnK family deacetylase [Armatimonadota bacterium]|nr:ChbG/HpnK family deacetylase [Armatimonadota bacterium]